MKSSTLESSSLTLRGPVSTEVTAGWRSGNCSAADINGILRSLRKLHIFAAREIISLLAGRYTLLDQIAHNELFPYALAHNIDITMGGVLNSGVLANPVAGATYNYLPAINAISKSVFFIISRAGST